MMTTKQQVEKEATMDHTISKRHGRRKTKETHRKRVAGLKTATLDQHLDDVLGRIRVEFARTGKIHHVFECVTDGEIFHVPANWPDRSAKAAACAALRDSFRRRAVNGTCSPAKPGWAKLLACVPPMIQIAVNSFR
jgi:hypothetical protein